MIGIIWSEIEANAATAALDHWTQYLAERLIRHLGEPETPAQQEAVDSLRSAINHAELAKQSIRDALADDEMPEYPGDMTFERFTAELRRTYDPVWTEAELRYGSGDR